MTYAVKDISVQDSNPVYFYEFQNSGNYYRYVASSAQGDNPATVVFRGNPWTPKVVIAGAPASTGDPSKDRLTLKIPLTDPLSVVLLGYSLTTVTTLTIYRSNYDDLSSYILLWSGRVDRTTIDGHLAALSCEPIFSTLQRVGLRRTFARTCDYTLYGKGCWVNKANFSATKYVLAIKGVSVMLGDFGDPSGTAPYTRGALLAPDGSYMTIVKHAGMHVYLAMPIPSLTRAVDGHPGEIAVTIYQGCDKTEATCHSRFNNRGNFPGWSEFPAANPFETAII